LGGGILFRSRVPTTPTGILNGQRLASICHASIILGARYSVNPEKSV
jgi:hypothetical protein